MIAEILSRLKGKAVEKHELKRLSYHDLTHQAAREFSGVSGDDIETIAGRCLDDLDRLGMSRPEDVERFEKDVKLISQRLEYAATHATGADAFARQEGLAQTIRDMQVEFAQALDAIRQKYTPEISRLETELRAAVVTRQRSEDAANRLRQTAGELTRERLTKAHADHQAALKQLARVRTSNAGEIVKLKDRLFEYRRTFKFYLGEPNTWDVIDAKICQSMRENHYRIREEKRQTIERLERDLKAFEQAQPSPELYQAVRDAEREVAEAEAALLVP